MFLFPGDNVTEKCTNTSIGLIKKNVPEQHRAIAPGPLLSFENSNYWVNFRQVTYSALLDDIILGVVKGKGRGHYKVDIGGPLCAVLDYLDFPNATKRNRPFLSVGDIVFAQVVEDAVFSDIRISCRTEAVKNMGVLKDGVIIKCGMLKSRGFLLFPPDLSNTSIEKSVFGLNGYMWVYPATHAAIRDAISLINT